MSFYKAPQKYILVHDGFSARVIVAILGSAGIIYANLAPVIVSGLAESANFTSETAGYVFSLNMFGTALGGFAVTYFVAKISWRPTAFVLLLLLLAADFISILAEGVSALYAVRFFHGLVGGALVGVGFSIVARIGSPERTFGLLIFLQLTLGGVGTAILMPLIAGLSVDVVWLALLGFSLLALVLMPFLDDYQLPLENESAIQKTGRAPWLIILLALGALFFFQAGQMSAFTFVIEIGASHDFDANFVNLSVAVSLWVGAPAALLVAWWSTRSGRLLPILLGTSFTVGSICLLLVGESVSYLLANVGFGIFFSLTIPYLLGISSELDNKGRIAAFAGFISSLGLATGPAIASGIVGGGGMSVVIYFAAGVLLVSMILVIAPARLLDARSDRGLREW